MAYFILPPPQFIADNQEIPQQVVTLSQTYQNQMIQKLNLGKKLFTVTMGGYKGTQVYEWGQNFNGILLTAHAFEKKTAFSKQLVSTATILKQNDCTHLGSLWALNSEKSLPFPISTSTGTVEEIIARKFNPVSPLKLNYEHNFTDPRYSHLFNLILMEEFSKKKNVVVSNFGREFCQAQLLKDLKLEQLGVYPAKPHQLIQLKINEKIDKNNQVTLTYEANNHSGVFGQSQIENKVEEKNILFDPQKIAQNITNKYINSLQDMGQTQFKIVRRFGSWVYLDRGRAQGLKIGMRLVGNGNSTLHVIRYSPTLEKEIDGSIAFIRHENKENPLKVGDLLQLDPKIYPK